MADLFQQFDIEFFLKFTAAFVALTNPLYGIPIFLGMTQNYTPQQRRRTANVVALTVFVAATIAALLGEEILAVFGIDVPAFQIAGGIIVLGIGLTMLSDNPVAGDTKATADGHEKKSGIAVVPLSIPLTVGPGSFATIILFAHLQGDGSEIVMMIPAIICVSLLVWIGLLFADPISRLLGNTVISVVTRIMGIILAAVAVEMVINGSVQVLQEHFSHLAKPASG